MADNLLCIDQLPSDVQLEILKFIPVYQWPLVKKLLRLGLSASCIWKKFDLDELDDISDGIVELLVKNARSVRCMTWTSSVWNSSYNFSLVLQSFLNIQSLSLAGNDNITDMYFLYHLRKLEKLDLSGCTRILEHQFDILLPILSDLVALDVSECK